MQLHGLHHVTSVTGKAKANVDFYTQTLGLRLVKKTVNQDDVSAYHLFYADKLGTPGTDITFFDWPKAGKEQRGTDSIVNTLFRVNGRAALDYWLSRFDSLGVAHQGIDTFAGRERLRFEDAEGQRLTLVDDGGVDFEGEVWDGADVPTDYGIRGFYGIVLSVPKLENLEPFLTHLLEFEKSGEYPNPDKPSEMINIYMMDGGGAGKEVHVIEQPTERIGRLGIGGTHHVAFRLRDVDEQDYWRDRLAQFRVPNSGVVERYYFSSLYFRVSGGILFELATDEPGFDVDEPLESLGERLALPPFLEPQRAQIEAGLKPIN